MLNKKIILLSIFCALSAACTKETVVEKTIIPERQAPADIQKSISLTNSSNTIQISKSVLGKAFILKPSLISSGQFPDINYIKPIIVSFERSGQKIALFNLTDKELYNTITSSRLLQTFTITKEDDQAISIDLDKGFMSLNADSGLGVIYAEEFNSMVDRIRSGNESAIDIKDSFIQKVSYENNNIQFEQIARISLENVEKNMTQQKSKKDPDFLIKKNEVSVKIILDLAPYNPNKLFSKKIFDQDLNVGYFVNFVVDQGETQPIPYISRWDSGQNLKPITVRLHNSTPADLRPALIEGILYWNRVIGHQHFVMGDDFNSNDKQDDKTVFVYWINWDSAGFARAGFQTDPLTGEILKAQVFMTSSWYKSSIAEARKMNSGEKSDQSKLNYACQFKQSDLKQEYSNFQTDADVKKASLDIIRTVIAHEMGHVMGLRHNFKASAATDLSTTDYNLSRQNYLKKNFDQIKPVSTSVMDYTDMLETAMNGHIIQSKVLSYDQIAIDWAYNNKETNNVKKYDYCSDEHIMMAVDSKKNIYGCDRFDGGSNVIAYNINSLMESEKNQIQNALLKTIDSINSTDKKYYSKPQKIEDKIEQFYISPLANIYSVNSLIYGNSEDHFLTVKSVIDNFFSTLQMSSPTQFSDYQVKNTIAQHSIEIGGLSAIVKAFFDLQESAQSKYFENQVDIFYAQNKYNPEIHKMTEEQWEKLRVIAKVKAAEADKKYYVRAITELKPKKDIYEYDEATNTSIKKEKMLSSSFSVGSVSDYLGLAMKAYDSGRKNSKTVMFESGEVQFMFFNYDEPKEITQLFDSNSWPDSVKFNSDFAKSREIYKKVLVKNTLLLLKALNKEAPALLNAADLKNALSDINWSQLGLASEQYKFSDELSSLAELEKIK